MKVPLGHSKVDAMRKPLHGYARVVLYFVLGHMFFVDEMFSADHF